MNHQCFPRALLSAIVLFAFATLASVASAQTQNRFVLTADGIAVEHDPWVVRRGMTPDVVFVARPGIHARALPGYSTDQTGGFDAAAIAGLDPAGAGLRWEVYFPEENPYRLGAKGTTWRATLAHDKEGSGGNGGAMRLGQVAATGEYKYGIRVYDVATGALLHDFDPRKLALD
ncbi:MAG: hypothetical protein KDK11_16890 [Maritimibacter sp.]|nr:hypothetical protein [Maritimibacter sp.]